MALELGTEIRDDPVMNAEAMDDLLNELGHLRQVGPRQPHCGAHWLAARQAALG